MSTRWMTAEELLNNIQVYIDYIDTIVARDHNDAESNQRRIKAKAAVRTLRKMTSNLAIQVNLVSTASTEGE